MVEPVWTPSAENRQNSQLHRFMESVEHVHGVAIPDYRALHRWSVNHRAAFWRMIWELDDGVIGDAGEVELENGDSMWEARWFPDARLNVAENLLRRRDHGIALVARDERGFRRQLSHSQLARQVAALASALRADGVGVGDRVAGLLPNSEHAVIGFLATASIGAVWSSCSPDFGAGGVIDRFGQIKPRVLLVTDGYSWNGKPVPIDETVQELIKSLPGVRRAVRVPFLEPSSAAPSGLLNWDDYLRPAGDAPLFQRLPFSQPLVIAYSSGTTGVPKCIVHSAGGVLLQHIKEHRLHTDLRAHDGLFYYTTCGWMMWNWLVSGLASDARLVLYDGSPFSPAKDVLWHLAQEERVSVFGTSARYLATCEKHGLRPSASHDLSALRSVLSTGSPLAPESFDYVYREIGRDLMLASISGGTDILSCFALGCPVRPVYRGELQCLGLGLDAQVFDEHGQSLPRGKGELVCTQAFPSMPVGFWNDPGGKRYHDAYFARYPGVWAHGDYAERTEHDGLIIHGRSDAVLNPGGVRIGTAEIYRQVERLDEVLEALCIGQDWRGDVRLVLFLRLREGIALDAELKDRVRAAIRENTTPRHVPARIIQVDDLPRTLSGKLVELAVRDMVHGRAVLNRDALANPECLEQFRDLPELTR